MNGRRAWYSLRVLAVLQALAGFEVVEGGAPIDWDSGSCDRSAITE